jgi:hypothetical protein
VVEIRVHVFGPDGEFLGDGEVSVERTEFEPGGCGSASAAART